MTTSTDKQVESYLEAIDLFGGVQVTDMETIWMIVKARPGTMFRVKGTHMSTADKPTVQVEVVDDGQDD